MATSRSPSETRRSGGVTAEAARNYTRRDMTATNVRIEPPRWAKAWQGLMDWRIGAVPVPVAVMLAATLWYFVSHGTVAADLPMMIGLTMLLSFICAEIGHRIPGLRTVGGAVIVATFLPSALTYYHVLPHDLVAAVTGFTKTSNYLFLYIAAIIVGSVFGMDRTVLIRGFVKIFAPLAAGTVAALVVGGLVGAALGLGLTHALFYVVLPVMAGGVGDGAVPLSLGYAGVLHQGFGGQFAQVLPPVMIGSFFSVLIAGGLNWLGKRRPEWSGEGSLLPGGQMDELLKQRQQAPAAMLITPSCAGTCCRCFSSSSICPPGSRLPSPDHSGLRLPSQLSPPAISTEKKLPIMTGGSTCANCPPKPWCSTPAYPSDSGTAPSPTPPAMTGSTT